MATRERRVLIASVRAADRAPRRCSYLARNRSEFIIIATVPGWRSRRNGDVVLCQRGFDEQKIDDRVSGGEIGVHDEAMIQGQSRVGDEFCTGALCGRKGPFISNCSAPREWICDVGPRPSPWGVAGCGIQHLAVSPISP